ncbi:MAG: ABC transporter permease [Acidobacteria bacterium]|nr:ABC transporter permease [Acidobacteriota bacterium]
MTADSGERPLGVFGYFVHEAVRRLWVYKRTSMVAIGMIAIALMTLGSFLLISENLNRAVDRWQGQSQITVFLTRDATPAQIDAARSFLTREPELSKFTFVSREAAYAKFRKHFTQLAPVLDDLDQNPFPPSFEVQLDEVKVNDPPFAKLVAGLRRVDGVDDVQLDWQWVSRLRRIASVLSLVGLIAGGVLAVAAAFTIANVIRLTMFLYREEIDIMRLVGATEATIRGPFLLEGIFQGMCGGVLAVALLYGLFRGVHALATGPASALLWEFLFSEFIPWPTALALIGGGVAAGFFGSWISVREAREEKAG